MMFEWKLYSQHEPPSNKDLLVCFDDGNCIVARYIKKSNNGRNYWESDDHIFEVDVSDMWCEILYPEDCM